MHPLIETAEYFRMDVWHFWAVVAMVVLFGFLISAFFLAYREYRMKNKAKDLVQKRYAPPSGQGSRRLFPRLLVRIPARVMVDKAKNVIEAEVLDVSAGGIRLLLFDSPRTLHNGESLEITVRDPLFVDMQSVRIGIVRVRSGPRVDTPTIHGKWENLPADTTRRLSSEIRRRLLHES
jgi:PilZ domain